MVTETLRKSLSLLLRIPLYQVGGSVRDEFLGLVPHDIDFATPSTPDEIETAVRGIGKHPYLVGKRFGTVGVKLDGQMYEITTFRSEQYNGSRKPQVEFVKDIVADLSRRDFTVNAMARGKNGFIDPFGGRYDLKAKVIRCVGSPKTRFKEDPLRMLRAARFAAKFGFTIDLDTYTKMAKMAPLLLTISKERWVMEMDQILMLTNVGEGLRTLMGTSLLKYMIPELGIQWNYDQHTPYHLFDLWTHTRKVVEYSPADLTIRWAALLHDVGKPFVQTWKNDEQAYYIDHEKVGREMVIKIGTYLKWSNARIKAVSDIVGNHLQEDSPLREADNKGQEE